MNRLHDVHTIAERFLRDIESGKVSFYAEASEEPVIPTADAVVTKVMVMRDTPTPYLVGVKRDGTVVWSTDVKHAKAFDSDSLTLVSTLVKCKELKHHVETFPACWFHA